MPDINMVYECGRPAVRVGYDKRNIVIWTKAKCNCSMFVDKFHAHYYQKQKNAENELRSALARPEAFEALNRLKDR